MLKSIYRRGADDGLILGIYFSVMSILSMTTQNMPLLSLASLIMFLLVPFVLYRFLRKCYVAEHGLSQFSALWMLGILIVPFGSLICVAVT